MPTKRVFDVRLKGFTGESSTLSTGINRITVTPVTINLKIYTHEEENKIVIST